MKLFELKPKITKKKRKRVGRGEGSGHGKTSGRGHKGQKARSGKKIKIGYEGGQMPLMRRIPKRGFSNISAKRYQAVNISALDKFEKGQTVDIKFLKEKNLISRKNSLVKILGEGKLTKPLKVTAHAFSKKAKEEIERAKGTVIIIK